VKAFLANAAAEHGVTAKRGQVNLADVVSNVLQNYQEPARRKNLSIHVSSLDGCPSVYAESNLLTQILDNLLSNAVKFSPSDRQISITIRPNGEFTECVIQDQGPGFTEEDKARMFRRYGRLSARPTGGETSTGLGLSIVKKLVDEINGELICESAPGQGAGFVIRLPRSHVAA
jgi:two-component system sensor histidine kinase/response regulator